MAEYLVAEFPGLGAYTGIQDADVLNRVHAIRQVPDGLEDIFKLENQEPEAPKTEMVEDSEERE